MRRIIGIMTAVLMLTAPSAAHAGTLTGASAPAPEPLTPSAILSAPVPSLCGHPAGRLVRGKLPGLGYGEVTIQDIESRAWAKTSLVIGRIDKDSRPDAAVAMRCNLGGVGWPGWVLFYGPGPRLMGGFDLSRLLGEGRQHVTGMKMSGRDVVVDVGCTYDRDEGGGLCTVSHTLRFRHDGRRIRASVIARNAPRDAAGRAWQALKKNDRAAIDRLFTRRARADLVGYSEHVRFLRGTRKLGINRCTWPEGWEGAPRTTPALSCRLGTSDNPDLAYLVMVPSGSTWKVARITFGVG